MMGEFVLKEEKLSEDSLKCYVLLMKDRKPICRAQCINPPCKMPTSWSISDIVHQDKIDFSAGLLPFHLCPASENSQQALEWQLFLGYLQKRKKVAIANIDFFEFYILPPDKDSSFNKASVLYKENCQRNNDAEEYRKSGCMQEKPLLGDDAVSNFNIIVGPCSPDYRFTGKARDDFKVKKRSQESACRFNERNYVRADPSYLKTLGQAHSAWIFGAMAELIDNSRDAEASRLDISIEMIYSKHAGKSVPMLSIVDDGIGMCHEEIVKMISFGHKQPETDNPDRIGRFGVGFKTGAMRLGKDALVLTQSANSRSIAFLSQTLNEGKDNLEIPIVSYRRNGRFMEMDSSVQDEDIAKFNLKAIKDYSPFNKYLIGEKAAHFSEKGTGTQIYIWNLDEWGSNCSLQWESGMSGGSTFHQGDILIRSRRIRSRPGQMSQKVPLDYSLRSYLEVIFFDPRMRIYVQGALVKSRPLAKSLNKTTVQNGIIMEKSVQLTLGRCQLELEQANGGIFLYWHGRLIEAYKRVGSMIHNGDKGHGIIGVIDVTELMDEGNGRVWVHSNKQGFQDCEAYAVLEKWLGERTDEYLDKYVDKIQLRKGNSLYKPDHEWVQCDKCRKWRMLSAGFDSKTLPPEWFCFMKPFNGICDMPEQKVERGVITVNAQRSGYSLKEDPAECGSILPGDVTCVLEGGGEDRVTQSPEGGAQPSRKRCRKAPPRSCRKN